MAAESTFAVSRVAVLVVSVPISAQVAVLVVVAVRFMISFDLVQ